MENIEQVIILDFGSQYTHIIARRFRILRVYSKIVKYNISVEEIKAIKTVRGVILSGGPCSVYDDNAPHLSQYVLKYLLDNGIPVLGICYGLQEIIYSYNPSYITKGTHSKEYGRAIFYPREDVDQADTLLKGFFSKEGCSDIWMSHGDSVREIPSEVFSITGYTDDCKITSISMKKGKCWGFQFHPEVSHTKDGKMILSAFIDECKITDTWEMEHYSESLIAQIKTQVGDDYVLGALSGGVDSTVAAALLQKAIGDKFIAFTIDNGFLRYQEGLQIANHLRENIKGLNLTLVDACEHFYSEIKDVEEPETKRKIIGRVFIEEFETAVKKIKETQNINIKYLLQGTLYPDVIESLSFEGPSHTIKTHHNVGGLPEKLSLTLLEPLRMLFKDEVRELGVELGLPFSLVMRHPFPGPGLAIRIIGSIDKERIRVLQACDKIYIEELINSDIYKNISQAFTVLLPHAKSVGVMGDCRTYAMTVCLRAVTTTDFMTADWYRMDYDIINRISSKIINQIPEVNRVVYDVSSKPPATIEWE